jgi:hypothetical protein
MVQLGVVTFAGKTYTAGRRWAHASIDVTIVAGSVQLSKDGQVIRVHPIRHDRAKELGAFASPRRDAPGGRTPLPAMSPSYRNPSVAQVPEIPGRPDVFNGASSS